MGTFSESSPVSLEELAADVGEGMVGEAVGGIEAEALGARRVVSPGQHVDGLDEVVEGVLVAEVAALEGLAAAFGLGVEDAPAEGGDVADVEAGEASLVGDAGGELPFGRGVRLAGWGESVLAGEFGFDLCPVALDEFGGLGDAAVAAAVAVEGEGELGDGLLVAVWLLNRSLGER